MKRLLFVLLVTALSFSVKAQTDSLKSDTTIFNGVDLAPEYAGGTGNMFKYIIKNFKYPKAAMEADIQGDVKVGFIIEKNGSLSNIQVVKSLSADTDAEALRLIKAMPNWIPGKQNGVPVRVRYELPVYFRLN